MSSHPDGPTFDPLSTRVVTIDSTPNAPAGAGAPAREKRFEPGSIIAGRYRLIAMLGRGGMGEVYRADDLNRVPMTDDFSHWSAVPSNWSLALILALACFGFYASRAGQPLFGRLLQD